MKYQNLSQPLLACMQDSIALQSIYLLLMGQIAISLSRTQISVVVGPISISNEFSMRNKHARHPKFQTSALATKYNLRGLQGIRLN